MRLNVETPLALRAFVIAIGIVAKLGLPAVSDASGPANCAENTGYACTMDLSELGRQDRHI